LGANFTEWVGIVRYQPLPRLNFVGKLSYMKTGRDPDGENWGGDILKPNSTRQQEYDNKIGQGVTNSIAFGTLTASWQFKHNLFVDLDLIVRKSTSGLAIYNNNTTISSVALRWNFARRVYEF
jgi:hypothetical protein